MEAGPQRRFFGLVEGPWAVLPPGMAVHAPALLKLQSQTKEAHLARLHAEVTLPQRDRHEDYERHPVPVHMHVPTRY